METYITDTPNPRIDRESCSSHFQYLRNLAGLTLEDMSRDFSLAKLIKYDSGELDPNKANVQTRFHLCNILGCELNDLNERHFGDWSPSATFKKVIEKNHCIPNDSNWKACKVSLFRETDGKQVDVFLNLLPNGYKGEKDGFSLTVDERQQAYDMLETKGEPITGYVIANAEMVDLEYIKTLPLPNVQAPEQTKEVAEIKKELSARGFGPGQKPSLYDVIETAKKCATTTGAHRDEPFTNVKERLPEKGDFGR